MERELRPELKNEQPIQQKQDVLEETRSGQRFEGASGTNVPPVEEDKKAAAPAQEENVSDLKEKIQMVVDYRFGGSYKTAFQHYGMFDDKIDKNMLSALLTAAGVNHAKGKWVKSIMDKVDTIDGRIPFGDFEKLVTSRWA
ncbi:MAG TPA: hypothetical protein VGM90_17520 [Kofleriaceae bacterium]|jgi:hypothetical protein